MEDNIDSEASALALNASQLATSEQLACSPEQAEATDSKDDMENYVKKFENLSILNGELGQLCLRLKKAQHDQDRVLSLTKYVYKLQEQNEQLYSLLVEMNNIFAGK